MIKKTPQKNPAAKLKKASRKAVKTALKRESSVTPGFDYTWNGPPQAGAVWFRPRGYVDGKINPPAETRHVLDRTLGAGVIFVSGRYTRFAWRQRCTLAEWQKWAKGAREKS